MADDAQAASGDYQGEIIFSWEVDEYERHERGPLWYAVAAIVGAALILYAIVSQNFLFAVIIIMAGVIIGLSTMREPRRIPFQITTRGLDFGGHFMGFKDLRSFWILYEPPDVKSLYVDFNNPITPHLKIPLEDEDPVAVRESLLEFMREDAKQESEPLSELLTRVLKL